jgi:hypothetical protein
VPEVAALRGKWVILFVFILLILLLHHYAPSSPFVTSVGRIVTASGLASTGALFLLPKATLDS